MIMEAVSEPLMHPMQFQVGGSALSLMAKRIGLLFQQGYVNPLHPVSFCLLSPVFLSATVAAFLGIKGNTSTRHSITSLAQVHLLHN